MMNIQAKFGYLYKFTVTPGGERWLVWWRLLRPHTLTASFIPVAIGTAMALSVHTINILLFLSMLLASTFIQAATNIFNEYYDFIDGLDHAHSVGIAGTIVRDKVAPKTILVIAYVFSALAILLGIYISMHTSWWIFFIGLICIMVGYLYSGGPYPIAATPFGELVAGAFMGLFIILISFFIQTGTITLGSLLISGPTSILIGTILMANNIRDLADDKAHGRKTLAILLGHKGAVSFLTGMLASAYLWLLGLVSCGFLSYWAFLVFASLPRALQATRSFQDQTTAEQMMPAMKATAQTNTIFGLLLVLALVLQY
ncbi:MAG: menA [Firmicutes bacterium]|nr:menA [Bacillota bacterium]